MFIQYAYKRPDGNSAYWKEIFITGLPRLFSERVLSKLQKEMNVEFVDYNSLTYGHIISFVKKEGLELCQELKLQKKYGSQRKELGDFCDAFGAIKLHSAPSRKHRKTTHVSKPYRRRKSHKSVEPSTQPQFSKKKKKFSKKKSSSTSQNPITCWKCGRFGHKANECKLKKKINEIIKEDDNLKQKLIAI